uniref:U1-type domain-containing protein n=1 Tax=Ciona savignyi TaxID=51511 RepID=H2YZR7_CIOSA
MSGVEFLFPIHGFYCSVCKVFCGDKSDGEEHCFSNSHNKAYAKFLKKNPLYEKPTQKSVKKSKKDKKEEKWEEKKIVIRKEVKSPLNESYKSNQDNGRKSQSFTAADRRAFERAPDEIRPVPPPQYLKSPPRSCVERDSHSPLHHSGISISHGMRSRGEDLKKDHHHANELEMTARIRSAGLLVTISSSRKEKCNLPTQSHQNHLE